MSGISGAARAVRMALKAGKWLLAYADNLMRVDSVEPKPAMETREE